jgi:hypothetical protein
MLLAGGIAGVAVPILLQNTAGVKPILIRVGSALLLTNIIVGAVFDAIDERLTGPLLLRTGAASRATTHLAFAEDMKLTSARPGQPDPDSDRLIEAAKADAKAADEEMRKAAAKFANISSVEAVLFFGAFLFGVAVLLLAVAS